MSMPGNVARQYRQILSELGCTTSDSGGRSSPPFQNCTAVYAIGRLYICRAGFSALSVWSNNYLDTTPMGNKLALDTILARLDALETAALGCPRKRLSKTELARAEGVSTRTVDRRVVDGTLPPS